MRNNFKLALVPLALASAFASNSALAACLEIYTGDNTPNGQYVDSSGTVQGAGGEFPGVNFNGVTAFDAEYSLVTCNYAGTGNRETTLVPQAPLTVARELTSSFRIDLFNPGSTAGATLSSVNTTTGFSKNVVYIPRSPIPGGTRITLRLANAVFKLDDPQLHLVALNDDAPGSAPGGDLDPGNPNILIAAASTDGGADLQSEYEFLVPSGLTIPAGTRLALSTLTNSIAPPSLQFDNQTCSVDPVVTIAFPEASNVIGGSQSIAGGVTDAPSSLVSSKLQFNVFANHTTANGTVNALADSFRTEFVASSTNGSLDTSTTTQVFLRSTFVNGLFTAVSAGGVEVGVAHTSSDQLELDVFADPSAADNVDLGLFQDWSENGAAPDTFGTEVNFDTNAGNLSYTYTSQFVDIPDTAGTVEYGLPLTSLFQGASNNVFFALTQRDTNEVIDPSRFVVNWNHQVDFASSNLLDSCDLPLEAYDINTNGAVLKVPYQFETGANWIRITNEFSQPAQISMDIQGERGTPVAPNSDKRGIVHEQVVPPNGSVLLFVDNLVEQAVMKANYDAGDRLTDGVHQRHTFTFTVSAPGDDVHGVAVQKIDGEDRVVPVLDENERWDM